jgi:hypothetical protein
MSRYVCNIGANRRSTPGHASASRVRHETFDADAAAAIDALDEVRALVAPSRLLHLFGIATSYPWLLHARSDADGPERGWRGALPRARGVMQFAVMAPSKLKAPEGDLATFQRERFTHDGVAHDVYRKGKGPAVLVVETYGFRRDEIQGW